MAPASPPPTPPGSRYLVLGVLFVVYVFNFVDRQILATLVRPIKAELGASDFQMGLLGGFVFALFYTLAGIPVARWADRGSRRNVILFSLVLWSLMTAVSGLARSFWQLAAARVGVGIGEAGGTPPSHSLLSDYFPPERRATAMALYGNGIYVGVGLGFMTGGYIVTHFEWRTAFYVVGLAGLPLALLLVATVREVPRGSSEAAAPVAQGASLLETLRSLIGQPALRWLTLGACFQAFSGYAILFWGFAFYDRVHAMDPSAIGLWLGVWVMLAGCAGVSIGGWLADRLGARSPAWTMRMPAVVAVLGLPAGAAFLMAGSAVASLAGFALFYLVSNMYVGPLWSTTQNLARPDMRATASAALLFVLNLAGLGLGPPLIGRLNDWLTPGFGDEAIRWSLLIAVGVGGLAAPFFWRAGGDLHAPRP